MRIFLLHDDGRESGPFSLEDLRDRVDLRMVEPSRPCRLAGAQGTYVAGELISGQLFHGIDWNEEETAAPGDSDSMWTPDNGEQDHTREDERGEDDADDPDDPDPDPDGDPEDEDAEDWPDEDEDDPDADLFPLWSGHPGFTAFPRHLWLVFLLALVTLGAWWLEWSGWLAVGLAATTCFALALLLGRKHATRYAIYPRRIEWTEGMWFAKTRELARAAVHSVEVQSGFPTNLLGCGDLVFRHAADGTLQNVVFRKVARPGRIRQAWRSFPA